MKLYISQVGIVDSISNSVRDVQSDLNNCRYTNLSCPSTFKYASYVGNLKSKIDKNIKELNYINNALKKSERKYDDLFEENKRKFSSITEKKIPEKRAISENLI